MCAIHFSLLLDPWWKPEGSYKIGSVLPSILLSRGFLGIVSLVFSEIWHGARNSYEVVCDTAGYSGKKFFATKFGKRVQNGPKTGLFQFIGKFGH